MGNGINLPAIFIANGMALILAAQLLFGNNWNFAKQNDEYRYLRFLIYMSALACIVDPVVFLSDGRQGIFFWLIVYVGNMFLFIDDILVGVGWIVLLCKHLNGYIPKFQRLLIVVLSVVGIIAIVVNLFTPVIFFVDENSVYHREALFWLFTFIEGVLILDGVCVYFYTKIRGGIFKFFPVLQFVIPIVAGIALQGAVYGVSVVYPGVILSLVGLSNSLKEEALFMDSLTGLYNRSFMNLMEKEIARNGLDVAVTALMLDINGFKAINDVNGHAEGDNALTRAASILKTTVGALGCVIRYAGDEFIILLNTNKQDIVDGCIKSIHREFQSENESSNKPYKLEVSIGCCSLGKNFPSFDDMLSEADRLMYVDKKNYYSNPSRDRRSTRRGM